MVGASWNCLCLAQGSPSLSSQRFSAVSSGYHNQTPVLSTVRFLCAQPVSVSVDGSTSICCVSHSSNLVQAAKVLQAHSVPLPQSLMKGLNGIPVSIPCTSDWPPAGLCTADPNALSPALQPVSVHLTVHLSSPYFISVCGCCGRQC